MAYLNAKYSGIARYFTDSLYLCLKNKWAINDGYDAPTFDAITTNILCGHSRLKALEVDFSKFDKSQELICLMCLVEIMRRFNVPQEFLDEWVEYHIKNNIVFISEGFRLHTEFQRRSGDILTFIGNTIVNMCAISFAYDCRNAIGECFAGDDSIVWFEEETEIGDKTQTISNVFNLVAKIEHHETCPMFCSKFLIPAAGKWCWVPDPLKVVVKLGRTDITSSKQLEEFIVSFKDNQEL